MKELGDPRRRKPLVSASSIMCIPSGNACGCSAGGRGQVAPGGRRGCRRMLGCCTALKTPSDVGSPAVACFQRQNRYELVGGMNE